MYEFIKGTNKEDINEEFKSVKNEITGMGTDGKAIETKYANNTVFT